MDHGDAGLIEHEPIELNRTMFAEVIVRSHFLAADRSSALLCRKMP
ncbi:hypothetical protein ACMYR2_3097 [Nitrobacter sp. TKz-YC01]